MHLHSLLIQRPRFRVNVSTNRSHSQGKFLLRPYQAILTLNLSREVEKSADGRWACCVARQSRKQDNLLQTTGAYVLTRCTGRPVVNFVFTRISFYRKRVVKWLKLGSLDCTTLRPSRTFIPVLGSTDNITAAIPE